MLITYLRTVALYSLLIGAIRLMGKRQVGQMEPTEFVVAIWLADLASIPMESTEIPLLTGIVPLLTVLGLELVLSGLSMTSIRLRRVLCGKPVILVENGKPLQENLRKTRVTLDELSGHLREKDVLDISTVQYAILETNGNLSVFPYPKERPASAKDAGVQAKKQYLPLTIVSDGRLIRDNLKKAGKDEAWLKKVLSKNQATRETTYLLTVDGADRVVFYPKEGKL